MTQSAENDAALPTERDPFDYWVATTDFADDRGRIFNSEAEAEAFIVKNGAANWARRHKGSQIHGGACGIRTSYHWMEWDRGQVTRTGRKRVVTRPAQTRVIPPEVQ